MGPKQDGPTSSAASSLSRGAAALRSVARLLLVQVGVAELHKAQARSFGHAKRRARIATVIEENKPPPAPKRSIGLNDRMNPSGTKGGGGRSGSGRGSCGGIRESGGVGSRQESGHSDGVSPEAAGRSEGAEAKRGTSSGLARGHRSGDSDRMTTTPPHAPTSSPNCCPSCGLAVLGHPLDTISSRYCGGGGGGYDPAQHIHRQQPGAPAPAAGARAGPGVTAVFKPPKPLGAAADAECARKPAGFGTTRAILAKGVGSGGASVGVRGKRMGVVGAAAVSQASSRSMMICDSDKGRLKAVYLGSLHLG